MSLKEKVSSVAHLLEGQPGVERLASLSATVTKLSKAIDDFLAKAEPAMYKNSAEFAELWALLMQRENKETVTPDWLNQHAGQLGKKFTKAGKKEKEDFAVAMVRTGQAPAVIQELKESPKRKMQDLLYSMVGLPEADAAEKIKAMKPKQLTEFCRLNEIPIVQTAKGSVDKKRTLPNIIAKIGDLQEYLKL